MHKFLKFAIMLTAGFVIVWMGVGAARSGLDAITTMKESSDQSFRGEIATGFIYLAAGVGTITAALAMLLNKK